MRSTGAKLVYSGETPCQGVIKSTKSDCEEMAKFQLGQQGFYCGRCIRRYEKEDDNGNKGRELPKNPRASQIRDSKHSERAMVARAVAQQRRTMYDISQMAMPVEITASPLYMMKEWSFVPKIGFLPVFPNAKHGHGFNYGFGDFSGMSPMKLGPVIHGQIGTFPAKTIEVYHQGNKVFPCELSSVPCTCPRAREWPHMLPAGDFYENRDGLYGSSKAQRHKFSKKYLKEMTRSDYDGNINIPEYSVHVSNGGIERHFTYVESRWFYCSQMERLATVTPAFKNLLGYIAQGFKIEIVGYDAYPPQAIDPDTLYAHYLDPGKPFGHEMVILCLAIGYHSYHQTETMLRDFLPWHRYYKEHRQVYEGPGVDHFQWRAKAPLLRIQRELEAYDMAHRDEDEDLEDTKKKRVIPLEDDDDFDPVQEEKTKKRPKKKTTKK